MQLTRVRTNQNKTHTDISVTFMSVLEQPSSEVTMWNPLTLWNLWPGKKVVTWKQSCDLETKLWTGNKTVTWKQSCDLETKLSLGCKVVTWKQSCDLEITSSNKEYPTMKTCVTNVRTWLDSWFWFPKSRIFHIKKLALTIEIIYFGCSNTSAI